MSILFADANPHEGTLLISYHVLVALVCCYYMRNWVKIAMYKRTDASSWYRCAWCIFVNFQAVRKGINCTVNVSMHF